MATVSTKRKSRKAPTTFRLTLEIGKDVYSVFPLDADPDIGHKAFRFLKGTPGGDGAVYDLHVNRFGVQCQCKGFLHYGYCKHQRATQRLSGVFNLMPPANATADANAAAVPLPGGGLGQASRNNPEILDALAGAPEEPAWTDADFRAHAAYFGQS